MSYTFSNDEPGAVVEFCSGAEEKKEINCKECGSWLEHEHPDIPGLLLSSSDYVGTDLCFDCMRAHCAKTNCSGCAYGNDADCKLRYL